jgi:uncharacterized protein with FMN-binding domain
MVGTKIFVLQMKDLIRMAVFAVLGLILIILLVFLFIPRGSGDNAPPSGPASRYIPGTYSSSIILNGQAVDVYVTVTDNVITGVEMADMDFTQRVFYPLFKPRMADLATEVLYYQSAEIIPSTDHPITTGILQQAVAAALSKAETGNWE